MTVTDSKLEASGAAGLSRLKELQDKNAPEKSIAAQGQQASALYDSSDPFNVGWNKDKNDQLVVYFRDPSNDFEAIAAKMNLPVEAVRRRLHWLADRRDELKNLRTRLR